jgi:hypothetical protein
MCHWREAGKADSSHRSASQETCRHHASLAIDRGKSVARNNRSGGANAETTGGSAVPRTFPAITNEGPAGRAQHSSGRHR